MMLHTYGSLFGERSGAGPLRVLALHGWGRDRTDFRAVLRDVDALAVDLPGFGATPPPSEPMGAVGYAASLLSVLEEFPGPCVLLGHSFGGRVAVCLAWRHPHLVRGMVLTGAPLLRRQGARPRPDPRYRIWRALHSFGAIGDERLEKARMRYGSMDYRSASGIMRAVLVTVLAETYERELTGLSCPVELVWGSGDDEVPVEVAERAAALIPSARVTVVPNAGHLLPLEAPERLREAVERLL